MVSSMPTTASARTSEGYIVLFGLNEWHMLPETLKEVAKLLSCRYTMLLSKRILTALLTFVIFIYLLSLLVLIKVESQYGLKTYFSAEFNSGF